MLHPVNFFVLYRWVNLKAIRRLVDTNALKIENLSVSKVYLYFTH
jgi:hypothetical protein